MKFTIIIPIYNLEAYIEKTLFSISKQTYKDFEIILVDDGSQDGSVKIITKLCKLMFSDYKILIQNNHGVSSARNLGLKHSHGDYVIFLDGDDYFENDKYLENVNIFLMQDECDIICSNFKKEYPRDKFIDINNFSNDKLIEKKTILQSFLKREKILYLGNLVFKKTLLEKNKIIFNIKYKKTEDLLFIARALVFANKIYISNIFSYVYLQREGSAVNQKDVNYQSRVEPIYEIIELVIKFEEQLITECNIFKNKSLLYGIDRDIKYFNYTEFKKIYKDKKFLNNINLNVKHDKKTLIKVFLLKKLPFIYFLIFKHTK